MVKKGARATVRKAVLPAAGLGTRFLPATKAMPKEMLPLVDKPLIQYALEEVVAAGIRDVCIVTGRGKSAIEDHFDESFELEHLLGVRGESGLLEVVRAVSDLADIAYVRQREALGLGHAVLRARNQVGKEPCVVVLADDVIASEVPCTRQLLDIFERYGDPVVALMEVPPKDVSAYGVVQVVPLDASSPAKLYRILNLVEKPEPHKAPSNLAIIGRYVLTPDIFDVLEQISPGHGEEIQLTDGLKALSQKRSIYGLRFEGKRYDAGNKLGFLKATVEMALRRSDLGRPFRDYLSALNLRPIRKIE